MYNTNNTNRNIIDNGTKLQAYELYHDIKKKNKILLCNIIILKICKK